MADYAWHNDSAKDNVLYDLVWKPAQAVSVSSCTNIIQLVNSLCKLLDQVTAGDVYNTKTLCLW